MILNFEIEESGTMMKLDSCIKASFAVIGKEGST